MSHGAIQKIKVAPFYLGHGVVVRSGYTGNVVVGSMYKVMKTFVCRGCVNPVTGTGCTSVDIGFNANLELVDKFCYLGDECRWRCRCME